MFRQSGASSMRVATARVARVLPGSLLVATNGAALALRCTVAGKAPGSAILALHVRRVLERAGCAGTACVPRLLDASSTAGFTFTGAFAAATCADLTAGTSRASLARVPTRLILELVVTGAAGHL